MFIYKHLMLLVKKLVVTTFFISNFLVQLPYNNLDTMFVLIFYTFLFISYRIMGIIFSLLGAIRNSQFDIFNRPTDRLNSAKRLNFLWIDQLCQ